MTSASLDLVRSINADWERGDYRSADWAHPKIEYVIADGPSPGTWRGLAAMAEAWRGVLSAFEEFRGEAEQYREIDAGRVLVLSRFTGRGKTSGVELGQMHAKGATVYHVRGSKVTRIVVYFNRDRALADLRIAQDAGAEP